LEDDADDAVCDFPADQLDLNEARQCDGDITFAIYPMNADSSPGSDGLPVEFRFDRWRRLGHDSCNALPAATCDFTTTWQTHGTDIMRIV